MTYPQEQIVADIESHIRKSGAQYWREWCVGISKNARDRLFNGHGVNESQDWWIFRQAISSAAARDVESHFREFSGNGRRNRWR